MTRPNDARFRRALTRFPIRGLAAAITLTFVLVALVAHQRDSDSGSGDATGVPHVPEVAMPASPTPPVLPTRADDVASPPPTLASRATPEPAPASEQLAVEPDNAFATYLAPGEGVGANELGRIPILMYHAFVHDEANTDEWTLTFDQFREQLDWLVANDFVMVGMGSVISRDFDVPAGKKPVVLTFDDSSGGQFRLQESADGGLEVNPDTAVAIIEEYKQAFPEFAGPAFFAVLPEWCFGYPDDNDPSTCEERLQWLIDNGYEIGNHTMEHTDLTDVSRADLEYQVYGPTQWFGERISGPSILTDVLVLPYGAYPADDGIRALLFDGMQIGEQFWAPTLILEVGASPARSPFHIEWTPNLSRYNTEPTIFWQWAESMDSGETVVFVSDGDIGTVTVPEGWEEMLNQDLISADGRRIVVETAGTPAA